MSGALVIAGLVVREALRRRLLLALLLLTLAVIALTGWGFSRIPDLGPRGRPLPETDVRLIASQLLILVMFMFSNVLGLSAVFVAAPAISGEVESGVALALLARPISRLEYVVGKWLGLAALVVAYAVAAASLEMVVVNAVVGYVPPRPLEFLAFVTAEGLVLLTFALLLSTRIQGIVGGVIALVLFGIAWLGGIVGGIGVAFDNATLTHVGTLTKLLLPTDGLWRGAVYALEPSFFITAMSRAPSGVAAANPFFATTPPPAPYLVWSVLWLAGVLALAVVSFRRREV